MKNLNKNVVVLGLLIVVVALLSAFLKDGDKKVEVAEIVQDTKVTVTIGTSGGYKPYTYMDESGELTGFDVEIWKAIGEEADIDVEFVTSDFSGLFGMLDSDKLTTIANQITVTEAREEKYIFSKPYVYYGAQLVVSTDDNETVSLETLKGKRVGVSLGSNYEQMVKEFDVNNEIEVITYESYQGSLQDVSLGRIDAVLNDRLAGLAAINESGLEIKFGGEPVSELFNAFPLVKSDESEELLKTIDAAIDSLSADGSFAEISSEYFGVDITKK